VSEQKFNEWLAGLIDGDGSFLINQEKYGACEITVGSLDEPFTAILSQGTG
jgi:ubiquinol-cytochrome c reductase cytochrome b subunit